MSLNQEKNFLIIGICGSLAQFTAKILLRIYPNGKVLGVDTRNVSRVSPIPGLTLQTIKYSRSNFERVFRVHQKNHTFDCVFHLGRIGHGVVPMVSKRLDINIISTQNILQLCQKTKVKKVVLMSTYHVYGALPDNSVFLDEEAPLRASIKFPELRDVVEMDQIACNWMWKNQKDIEMIVLRPCNIIGPQIKNTMSRYLTSRAIPTPIDYNPVFQFINEFDMARVIYEVYERFHTGVYNIAPFDFLDIDEAINIVGPKKIPVPMSLLAQMNDLLLPQLRTIPTYIIDYLKFSCLISNQQMSQYLDKDFFRFTSRDAVEFLRLSPNWRRAAN